jgi:hypothetical protein
MVDVSAEASLQLNSTPLAGAQPEVSMWQNDLVPISIEKSINCLPARSAGTTAAYLDGRKSNAPPR